MTHRDKMDILAAILSIGAVHELGRRWDWQHNIDNPIDGVVNMFAAIRKRLSKEAV